MEAERSKKINLTTNNTKFEKFFHESVDEVKMNNKRRKEIKKKKASKKPREGSEGMTASVEAVPGSMSSNDELSEVDSNFVDASEGVSGIELRSEPGVRSGVSPGGLFSPMTRDTEITLYDIDFDTQFMVIVETQPDHNGIRAKVFSNLFFFELIDDLNHIGLLNLRTIGNGKAKITFDSALNANNFVLHNNFKSKNLIAYIPKSFVEKFGVIKHVPTKYGEAYILDNIDSPIPIHSVQRLKRRDPTNPETFIPTTTIKIGFKGKSIPKSVKFNWCICEVQYFVPAVKQCRKCGLLDHIAKFCKSKDARCIKCGSVPVCVGECPKFCCILCGSDRHNALFKGCQKKIERQNVKTIMTMENISFKEYKEKYSNSNMFDALDPDKYEDNFPNGLIVNNSLNIRNTQQEVNRILIKTRYNKVVKTNTPVLPKKNVFPVVEHHVSVPSIPIVNNIKSSDFERFLREMLKGLSSYGEEKGDLLLCEKLNAIKLKIDSFSLQSDLNLINASTSEVRPNEVIAV